MFCILKLFWKYTARDCSSEMAEARLLVELAEAKGEVERLMDRISLGTTTVNKDLSLINLVPNWTGTDGAVTLEEFIFSIENSVRIGRWEENDEVEAALLKLASWAKTFYKGCSELHADGLIWPKFKTVLRNRYKDVHTDQYHYMKLQTARKVKGEDPNLGTPWEPSQDSWGGGICLHPHLVCVSLVPCSFLQALLGYEGGLVAGRTWTPRTLILAPLRGAPEGLASILTLVGHSLAKYPMPYHS